MKSKSTPDNSFSINEDEEEDEEEADDNDKEEADEDEEKEEDDVDRNRVGLPRSVRTRTISALVSDGTLSDEGTDSVRSAESSGTFSALHNFNFLSSS